MDIFKVFDDTLLLERAFRVAVDGYRHQDYQRTIEVAKWCYQINTGDDQREILVKFRAKESERQKDQRVRVYNSRTPQVANKVKSLYNEVHRSDDVNDQISYEDGGDKDKNKVNRLTERLEHFDGLKSARSYLTRKNKYYVFNDPNAWLVIEFEGNGNERSIYPFEVTSEHAVDFHIERGVLQYLTAAIERKFKDRHGNTVSNTKYTLYAAQITIDIIEAPKDELVGWVEPEGYEFVSKTDSKGITKQYYLRVFETQNEYCPAYRFGFIDDVKTQGRTCVSPLHLAETTLQRLIWRTSTHDVSHACHGFYKMMMYTERCNHKEYVEGVAEECDNGWIAGTHCKSCKGTGKKMHLSDQDVVMYLIEGRDKIEPLSNLIHYATIPTDLIKEQKEEVEDAIVDALSTIFNENVFDKTLLANTATGIHYNWRAVNNRLMDYGDHDSEMYVFIGKTLAMIDNIKEGLQFDYGYASDFKLESVQELLTERQTAVTSNAPAEIIRSIDMKILAKQHRDNPEYVERFKVKDMFKPLRTKSKDERIMILEALPEFHPMKILNQYHDEIFDEIFTLKPLFVDAPYIKQKAYVDERVQVWIGREKEARQVDGLTFDEEIKIDEEEPVQQEP